MNTRDNCHPFTTRRTARGLSVASCILCMATILTCRHADHAERNAVGPRIDLSGNWQVFANAHKPLEVALPGNVFHHPAFATSRPRQFRLHRILTLPVQASSLGLRTGILSDGDRTFFNGTLIGRTNTPPGGPASYDRSRIYPIPDELLRPGQNEIEIEVDAFFYHEAGLVGGRPVVAPLPELYAELMLDEIQRLIPVGLLLSAGLYFGLLFARQRRQTSHLWLSVFFLLLGAYLAHRSSLKYMLGMDLLSLKRLEYGALFLIAPPLVAFFYETLPHPQFLHRVRQPLKLLNAWIFLTLASASVWAFCGSDLRSWDVFNVNIVQRLLWPALLCETIVRVFAGLLRRERSAWLLSIASLIALCGAVVDVLTHQGVWDMPGISHMTFLAFPLGLAAIQIDRLVLMQNDLETWNHTLEERVQARTAELNASLTEVNRLKEQQDGDYYLTSLLLQPLSGRAEDVQPRIAEVALFCRQKKQFLFRSKRMELGGDLNIAMSIVLGRRPYLAILNGDAMGKSMQGAGGALVLGTVFRSLLARTMRSPETAALFPEEWLTLCYRELQNAFRCFEGCMMASAILALLDEDSGCLYHLNAEHPRAVLCREGQPSFLCVRTDLRRFGFTGTGDPPRIQVTSLQPGDVVVLGTDGRDDLLVQNDRAESARMNDDPALFLRLLGMVETCDSRPQAGSARNAGAARLDELVRLLQMAGTLSDDLALVRIHWPGPAASSTARRFRRRARDLLQTGDLTGSLLAIEQYIEQYIEHNPADTASLSLGLRLAERMKHPSADRWRARVNLRLSA